MSKIVFDELPEFKKDLKNFLKKFRTLNDDLEVVKRIASKALKGSGVNSGLRLIYVHFEVEQKITFIELYHKNDKENEDKQRILNNFINFKSPQLQNSYALLSVIVCQHQSGYFLTNMLQYVAMLMSFRLMNGPIGFYHQQF